MKVGLALLLSTPMQQRVVVGLAGSAGDLELGRSLRRHGLGQAQHVGTSSMRRFTLPPGVDASEVATSLEGAGPIAFAEPDRLVDVAAAVNDPLFGYQNDLTTLDATGWISPANGAPITVAVIDTGVDATHPDLAGRVIPGWNALDGTGNTDDVNGHGTAMAGLIAASPNNATGLAGLCANCVIMPVRVADALGHANLSDIAAGLTWAADHGAQVALVSFGNLTQSDTVANAAQYFRVHGGVVFVAEGNVPLVSGAFRNPYLFSVGSSETNSAPPTDATWGMDLDLTAPMHNVLSTARGGGYSLWTGTSVSAALVAGIAANVWSQHAALTPERLVLVMHRSGTGVTGGYSAISGFGAVDEGAAMNAAQQVLSGYDVPVVYVRLPALPLVAAHGHLLVNGTVESLAPPLAVGTGPCSSIIDAGAGFAFDLDTSCTRDGLGKVAVTAQTANTSAGTTLLAEYDNQGPAVTASASSNFFGAPATGTVGVTGSVTGPISGEVCTWRATLGGATCQGTGSTISCGLDTTALDANGDRVVPDGPATLVITGYDSAGTAKSVSVDGVISNPFVAAITNLVSGDVVSGTVDVTVAASAPGKTISSMSLYEGSGNLVGTTSASSGTISWDSTGLTSASLYVVATATDGSTAQSKTVNVGTANHTYSIGLSSPTAGSTVSAVAELRFTFSDYFDVSDDLLVDGVAVETGLVPTQPSGGAKQLIAYWATDSFSDGLHTVSLMRHTRRGDAFPAVNGFALFVDNTPPSIQVTSPPSGAVVSGPFRMHLINADGSAARAEVRLNGTSLGTCQTPCSLDLSPSVADGPFQLEIVGVDAASNYSSGLLPLTMQKSSPLITLSAPGSMVHGVTTISATVAGMAAPVSVTYGVNDAAVGTGNDPYAATYDFSAYANTAKASVTATATDANGVVATTERIVTVDNAPPTVSITAPASAGAVARGTYAVTATVSDASPNPSATLSVDGSAPLAPASQWTWSVDTTQLADGTRALAVTATDEWGQAATATSSFLVDNTAPTASFASPSSGATVYGTVPIQVSALDATSGVARVTVSIDGTQVASLAGSPYTYSWATSGYGAHTLAATAYDKAGNTTTITETVTVDDRPPTVSISAPVANSWLTGASVAVQYSATSPEAPLTSCAFLVDSVQQASSSACSSSFTFDSTRFSDGNHTLTIQAVSSAGSSSASVAVRVDNAPPQVSITSPASGGLYGPSMAVQYTAADSAAGLTEVSAAIDGQVVRDDTWATYQPSVQVAFTQQEGVAGAHTLTITARNAAGVSSSSSTRFTTDLQPPTVSFSSPANGAWLRGAVTVHVQASDDSSVSTVQLLRDGVQIGSLTSSPFDFALDTTTIVDGSHTLLAQATDAAGNSATSSLSVGVDNSAPTGSFTSPSAGASVAGTLAVSLSANDPTSGVQSVQLLVDGAQFGTATAAPYAFSVDTRPLTDGNHTLGAAITDLAGNVANLSEAVAVDNSPPSLSLAAPQTGAYLRGTSVVQFNASDSSGAVQVAFGVDGTQLGSLAAAPYTFSWDTTTATDGSHTVSGTGVDAAGNRTMVSATVTVDNTAPSASFSSPRAGASVAGAQTIAISAADTIGLSSVHATLDGADLGTLATPPFGFTWNTASSADGAHALAATATDLAGNAVTVTESVIADNTAPTVSISNPAAGAYVAGHVPVTIAGADSNALASIAATADGNPLGQAPGSPATFSWDTTLLADGAHTLGATATDAAGNRAKSSQTAIVDNTPPSLTIDTPASDAVVRGAVVVSASASDATSGVASVQFLVDSTPFSVVASAPWQAQVDTTQLTPGAHTLAAVATDRAGNAINRSESVTVDNIPPSVSIAAPADGSWVHGAVSVQLEASDNLTVSSVSLQLDGSTVGTAFVPPFVFTLDSGPLAQGAHGLAAIAVDSAGNVSSVFETLNVDNAPPTASLASPANGAALAGTVVIQGSGSDDQALATIAIRLDGAVIASSASSPVSYSWNSAGAPDGQHTLALVATDLAGNTTTSAATVTVDNSPPTVSLTSPSAGAVIGASATLSAAAQDASGVDRVEFYLDGSTLLGTATSAPFSLTWNASAVAAGSHTLSARAYDALGNAATSAAVGVVLDHTAPTVAITSPAAGSTVQGTVTATASASDANGISRVEFYVDGATLIGTVTASPWSLSWNTAVLKAGSHTLTAKAFDNAGNSTTSSSVSVTVKDVTAPTVSITSPASGSLVSNGTVVTIAAAASDATGVTKVLFYVNGSQKCSDSSAPYSCSWTVPKGAGTTYTLTAKAYDAANNIGTSAAVSVTSQ